MARNLIDSENVVCFLRAGRGASGLGFSSSLSDQGSGAGTCAICGSRLLERSDLADEPAAEGEGPGAKATEPFIGGQDLPCRAGSQGPPGASYGGGGGGGYDLLLFGVVTVAGVPVPPA